MAKTFIAPKELTDSAVYFRKRFTLQEAKHVTLCLSALGCYKAWLNGKELDEQVFLPGRTSYRYRVQVQEYDVSDLVMPGDNILAVRLVKGWYGQTKGLYCELNTGAEGWCGAEGWRYTQDGPLLFHDMKLGEIYDARKESCWTALSFDDCSWLDPVSFDYDGELIPHEGEKILEQERFQPRVLHTPDGATVLDFGQNMAGYMRFTVTGHAGHTVKMLYGETLDENGNFTQKNLGFAVNKKTGNPPQTIQYTLREGTQNYTPQASVHGFQFVKLENWPEEVKAENFTAIAVYSDLKQVGSFSCSNEKINRLVSNIRWSAKGNFLDIPTDCPQRERAGWTGDIMVYSVPAAYQMDISRFLGKWLNDLMLEQGDDGRIPNIAPVPNATTDMTVKGFLDGLANSSVDGGMPGFMSGAAGWSDAIVKLPWVLYEFYGDKEILRRCYPAMKKHLSFMERRAEKSKIWNRFKGSQWKDLIDTGFHWGEWLEPGGSMPAGAIKGFLCPDAEVASAYFAWSAGKLAEIAALLGEEKDAAYYTSLHERVKAAYRKEFLKNGTVDSKRQCRYVRPVALELAEDSDRAGIVKKLNEAVIANGYRIGTGFLSTPHICNVLTDYGYADTAYRMLENEEKPGWLYEVNQGATTMWENWYGKDEAGKPTNSLNHYSPGAVIGWLYSRVAGIRPLAPGFERVLIAPVPGGSLQEVNCSYESAAGRIVSNWTLNGRHFTLHAETPRPAEIRLPDGSSREVESGSYDYTCEI